jgi:cyclopropane-fatty-acyl-phospholipid synthase
MTRSIAHARPMTIAPPTGPTASIARRAVLASLGRFAEGRLTIIEAGGRHEFGDPNAPADDHATIRIRDPRAYVAIAFGGSVGAGDSYLEGDWDATPEDVMRLVRLMLRNRDALDAIDTRLARLARPIGRLAYRLQENSRTGSRRNIGAHYDLSNELFRLFLDPTMTYSSGIFEHGAWTLEQASVEKLDRACRKLELGPGDHLLEIGTGWGSMALHAAAHYGCRVTTTTISREQAALARERVERAGLSGRITVQETDYRDLTGTYDKLVSIEMIEAVGRRYLGSFFRACSERLAPDGLMLLQAITIRDQYYENAARSRDWLKKHIFPGSCLLSIGAMQSAVTRETDLRLTHVEDLGPHYADTLARWRDRFNGRLDEVRALGFDERFVRLWNYYLSYCEGAFRERHCSVAQLLAAKPRNRRAPWVDHGPSVPLEAIAPA